MDLDEAIGIRLHAERERKGMTLEGVGAAIGAYLDGKPWTPQAVWQAERGRRQFRASQLLAFALVLDVPMIDLLAAAVPHGDERITIGQYELTDAETRRLFPDAGDPVARNDARRLQQVATALLQDAELELAQAEHRHKVALERVAALEAKPMGQ